MTRAWLLLAVVALGGCGPKYGMRVPDALVSKLPFESRIELLEAENELALAIDRRDEAQNEIARVKAKLRDAKARLDAAEDEADDAEDATSREVASLALAETGARVAYLRAQQEVNVTRLEIEELALRCAASRFELARLTAARKARVEGAESLRPEDLEAQVKTCEAEVQAQRAELQAGGAQAAKTAKEAWEQQKAALASKTFDARASPYVE